MKKWTISEKVVEQFHKTKVISGEQMNKICNTNWNNTCWVIQSLKKRGYDIKIIRGKDWLYIESYTLISYTKPFYLIARDIESNHPRLEWLVRFWYKLTTKWKPRQS